MEEEELPGPRQLLANYTVEDVCNFLRNIDGIMQSRVDTYCDAIHGQNIGGAVLLKCSLAELKSVLNMNFGDWELFHMALLRLRSQYKKAVSRMNQGQRDPSPRNRRQLNVMGAEAQVFEPHSNNRSHHTNSVTDREMDATPAAHRQPSTHDTPSGSTQKKPTSIENQISMEDAMISGILSTLNEEAHEDILIEALNNVRKESAETGSSTPKDMDDKDRSHGRKASGTKLPADTEVIYLSKSHKSSEERIHHHKSNSKDVERNAAAGGGGGTIPFCDQVLGDCISGPPSRISSMVSHTYSSPSSGAVGNWNISGSQCELNSVPTSPTKSIDNTEQSNLHRQKSTDSAQSHKPRKNKEKSRYMRDRLDSITACDIFDGADKSSIQRVNSASFNSSTNSPLPQPIMSPSTGAEDMLDVEPYAWISQTAPASPLTGRSRSGSRAGEYLFYLDSESEEQRRSRGSGQFTPFFIGITY